MPLSRASMLETTERECRAIALENGYRWEIFAPKIQEIIQCAFIRGASAAVAASHAIVAPMKQP